MMRSLLLVGALRRRLGVGARLGDVALGLLRGDQHEIEGDLGAARDRRREIDAADLDAEAGARAGEIVEPTIDRVHQIGAQLLAAGARGRRSSRMANSGRATRMVSRSRAGADRRPRWRRTAAQAPARHARLPGYKRPDR